MAALVKSLIPRTAQQDPSVMAPVMMPDDTPMPQMPTQVPQVVLRDQDSAISMAKLMAPQTPQVALNPNPVAQQVGHAQNQLQRLQFKDQPYQWNQHGVGGKIAHVLNVAGNIAGDIFAPNVMARIPGTQLNRQEQENNLQSDIGEGQKQLSAQGLQDAQTRNLDSQIEQRPADAEAKHQTHLAVLAKQGLKEDESGNIVPDEESPTYQKQLLSNELMDSTIGLRKAQADFEKTKGDPSSLANQLAAQRLQIAQQTQDRLTQLIGARQEMADAMMMRTQASVMGTGPDGKPLPGAMLTDEGQPVGSSFQSNVRPTGTQRTKGNMAESADQQIGDMKDIVAKRPDIFGPAAGRKTDFDVWLGSQDPGAQRFRAARTIAGDHLAGTFGGRSEAALHALDNAIGQFRDNPKAVAAGLDQLAEANRLFLKAGKVHTVGSSGASSGAPPPGAKVIKWEDVK